jgi:hypothetical protein
VLDHSCLDSHCTVLIPTQANEGNQVTKRWGHHNLKASSHQTAFFQAF